MRAYDDEQVELEGGSSEYYREPNVIITERNDSSVTIFWVLAIIFLLGILVWGIFYTNVGRDATDKIGVDVNINAPAVNRPAPNR